MSIHATSDPVQARADRRPRGVSADATFALLEQLAGLSRTTALVQGAVAAHLRMAPASVVVLRSVAAGAHHPRAIAQATGMDVRAVAATLTLLSVNGLVGRDHGTTRSRPRTTDSRGVALWWVTDLGRGRLDQAEAMEIRVVGAFLARLDEDVRDEVRRSLEVMRLGLERELREGPTLVEP